MENKLMTIDEAYTNGGYCSIALVDDDAKRKLFNAIQNPDYSLKEKVNTTINMVDLYVEPVDIAEKDALEIFVEGDNIILHKYHPSCVFCENTKNIISYKGKNVCPDCIKKLKEKI